VAGRFRAERPDPGALVGLRSLLLVQGSYFTRCDAGVDTGILAGMGRSRKITVEVDEALLRKAQRQSKQGVTGTVRKGLELVAAAEAYEKLAALRGKVDFSVSLDEMRLDRE